uniref:Uncharacterized protein n=1 Tax=Anguilla anguilla TaxID=7936 RepID=A0A0E9R8C2_ANGAN
MCNYDTNILFRPSNSFLSPVRVESLLLITRTHIFNNAETYTTRDIQ